MPSIDIAMARSLQGSAFEKIRDAVIRGIVHEVTRRNIIEDTTDKVEDIKTALSSWDNCMAANFCK
jgi:hypothetical protein